MVRGAPFVIESCEILSGDFSVIIGGEAPKHTTTSRKTCEVCFAGWLKKVSLGVECDTSTGSFLPVMIDAPDKKVVRLLTLYRMSQKV